ncbi:MAG TPA: rod shape-determining protein RodA [Thermoanaerobaculia bacterium]|jgi:rod shape determining protein RodA
MRSLLLPRSRLSSLEGEQTALRRLGNVNVGPLAAAFLLSLIGLATVASASAEQAESLLARQALWVLVGLAALAVALLFDYHWLVEAAPMFYGLGLVALVLVLVLGHEAGGARSWFAFGPVRVQPSEFHKIATVLLLARYLSRHDRPFLGLRQIAVAAVLTVVPMGLIALERDLGGAAMFLPMLAAMLLVAGVRLRLLVAASLLGLVLAFGLWSFGMKDYQRQRVRTFLAPEEDPLGAGYQVRQSKIAVGSGQWTGRGYGQGTQSQLRFLPERQTDFVMAVLAEEWGFLGVITVLGLFAWFISTAARIAMRSRDRAGILLVVGLLAVVVTHAVYNTAMVVGLLPITGIPLPFISYGGSFMLFNYLAASLVLNVDYRRYVNR